MVTWFRSQRENDDLNLLKIQERKQPPLTTAGFMLVCSEFEFYGHITVCLPQYTPTLWLTQHLFLEKGRVNQKSRKLSVISSKTWWKYRVSERLLCHSTCYVRNGNLLKSHVSKIHVKRICVNQGVGVILKILESLRSCKLYRMSGTVDIL